MAKIVGTGPRTQKICCLHVFSCVCTRLHVFALVCTCLHVFARVCMCLHVFALFSRSQYAPTPAHESCYNFWRVKKTCYTNLEFPWPEDSRNVCGQKKHCHPWAPEAIKCSKNDQNWSGPKFGYFCCLKVVGYCILSGKYKKPCPSLYPFKSYDRL